MKEILIVANWKENKTAGEASEWLEKFRSSVNNQQLAINNVVICPSFVVLPVMAYEISKLENVKLGAQDVSKFEEGQYTGEVSAKMLADFVSFVIVGHSERRRFFGETDEDVAAKSILALKYGLVPIICVSNVEEAGRWKVETRKEARGLKPERAVFVYEPVEHISTGGDFHPDDPEHANLMAKKIKAEVGQNIRVLYGGSVSAENVKSFVSQSDISGVLVGRASLDAKEFSQIVKLLHC